MRNAVKLSRRMEGCNRLTMVKYTQPEHLCASGNIVSSPTELLIGITGQCEVNKASIPTYHHSILDPLGVDENFTPSKEFKLSCFLMSSS